MAKKEEKNQLLFEQIDAYLLGTLPPEARQAFEAELLSDVRLREQVELQSWMIEAICEQRKAMLKQMLSSTNTLVPSASLSNWAKWIGGSGAAMAILLVWLSWWQMRQDKSLLRESRLTDTNVHMVQEEVLQKLPEASLMQENTDTKAEGEIAEKHSKQQSLESLYTSMPKTDAQSGLPVQIEAYKEQANPSGEAEEKLVDASAANTTAKTEQKSTFVEKLFYQYQNRVLILFAQVDYRLLQNVDIGDGSKDYIEIDGNFYVLRETGMQVEQLEKLLITDSVKIERLRKQLDLAKD